jgi:hypothetical protein
MIEISWNSNCTKTNSEAVEAKLAELRVRLKKIVESQLLIAGDL